MIKATRILLSLAAFVAAYAQAEPDSLHAQSEQYQRLLADEPQLAGQVAFDLRLGELALQQGEPSAAVFAFQRVLAQQPDNAEAHLGIARAYFDLGEDDSSKRHFDLLYAVADKETKAYLDSYLSALDQRSGVRQPRTQAFARLRVGYDDNITQIRDGQPPGTAGVFAIQSSKFSNAAAGINHQQPLGAVWHWQAGASATYEKYHDFDDFDKRFLNANAGVGGRINAWRWNVSLLGNEVRRDNQKIYQGFSLVGVGEHRVDGFWKKAGLRLFERDYGALFSTRDVDGYELLLGARHAGSNVRWSDVSLDLYLGEESAKDDPSDTFGRDYLTAKLRWYLALKSSLRLVAGYDYSKSDFNDVGNREDDYRSVLLRVSLANVWQQGLDLDVEISRDENDSSDPFLTYDRDRISIGLRYNWGV